jgi:hypothetical protein
MLVGALQTRSDRTFEAALSPGDVGDLTLARDLFEGWIPQQRPDEKMVSAQQPLRGIPRYVLALPPGGAGRLGYCLFLEPGEQAHVTVRARNDRTTQISLGLKNNLNQEFPLEFPLSENPGEWVERTLDLTPYLSESQGFLFWVYGQNTGTKPSPTPVLDRLSFQFTHPQTPPLALGSALFFSMVCFLCWFLLLGVFLPVLWDMLRLLGQTLRLPEFRARRFRWQPVLFLLGICAAGGVLTHPLWYSPKRHDDLWALGNTRLLAQKRFDTHDLFFRSRVRPGFLALALPIQAGLAHTLVSVSTTPSDFYQRTFFVYERTGWSWGTRRYPEASLLGLLTAFSTIALMTRMSQFWYVSSRIPALRTAFSTLLGLWFFWRVLDSPTVNIITLSATWAFCLAPFYLFSKSLWAGDKRFLYASGGATGLAILFNESALTVVAPLLAFQVFLLIEKRNERAPTAIQFASFWLLAGILPLLYYGCLIEGHFGEITRNFQEHIRSQEILKGTGFEERNLIGVLRALWCVLGPGGIVALAGLFMELTRILRKHAGESERRVFCFYLFWAIGCLPVFTLPYFYPRFLIYLIPAGAWFAAAGLEKIALVFFKRYDPTMLSKPSESIENTPSVERNSFP